MGEKEIRAITEAVTNSIIKYERGYVSYFGVDLPKTQTAKLPKDQKEKYFLTEDNLLLMRTLGINFMIGDPTLIVGETSTGKTRTIEKMCDDLGYELVAYKCHPDTTVKDLLGEFRPNPHITPQSPQQYIWNDGPVITALRQEPGKIKVLFIDELNFASAEVLACLHEVLDQLAKPRGVGKYILRETSRRAASGSTQTEAEIIDLDPRKTLVVGCMNPNGDGYLGRHKVDPAQARRWHYFAMSSEAKKHIAAQMLGAAPDLTRLQPKVPGLMLETQMTPWNDDMVDMRRSCGDYDTLISKFHTFQNLVENNVFIKHGNDTLKFDTVTQARRVRDFLTHFQPRGKGSIADTLRKALIHYYVYPLSNDNDRNGVMAQIENFLHQARVDTNGGVTRSLRVGG